MEYEPLFGSWHVTRKIGAGATGSVFEIEAEGDADEEAQRSALKVITIPSGGDDEVKALLFSGMSEEKIRSYYNSVAENMLRDYDNVKGLGSSNAVNYEEAEIHLHKNGPGMDILFRMELLTPMLDYFSNHRVDESEVVRMGIDICKSLEACRRQGLIHRDIKPANILVSSDGTFKLGDFGIAKIIEETQTSLSRKGTYTYMAPEVFRGEAYGQTADIYSLGMVLYQCLNDGRSIFLPQYPEDFNADDKEKAFAKRVTGGAFPPPAHGSDELKSIVMKACAFNKEDRWQTAEEMRRALENVAGEASGDALLLYGMPEGGLSDAKGARETFTRKRKVIAAVILACAASMVLFACQFPWSIESISGPADGTEIYIGDQLAPEYVIEPDFHADKVISFASSDEKVFEVDDEGVITAVGMGEATLTMRADDYTEDDFETSVKLTVVPKVTKIGNIADPIEITTGDSVDLKPELEPKEFSDEKVTYTVKDDTIAVVNGKGRLTATKAGETVLTLYAGGCTLKTTVKVSDPVITYTAPAYSSTGSNNINSSGNSGSRRTSGNTGRQEPSGNTTRQEPSGNKNSKGTFGNYEYFDGN